MELLNFLTMILNYIKIAFRNLIKHKSFSAINLLGLSFSMSVCLLIINVITDQLSHDNFHKEGDRIYRVITETYRKKGPNIPYATTYLPLAQVLRDESTGVEKTVRITKSLRADAKADDKIMYVKGLYADQEFFDLFNFKLKSGNISNALKEPFTALLSEETSYKFFGNTNPVGKTIDFEGQGTFTVTGVVQEPKGKSHIKFEAIGSASTIPLLEKSGKHRELTDNWKNNSGGYVYIKLKDDASPASIEQTISEVLNTHLDEKQRSENKCALQLLADITPSPLMSNMLSHTIPAEVIWFMGFLALIVILSASFNYTNLSISRALSRAKEVGVRKVAGAKRTEVIVQFLVESVLYSFVSLVFAIVIYKILLDAFNGMSISSDIILDVSDTVSTYFWFVIFSVVVGFVAGLSPALFMSSFKPIVVLKNFSGIKLFSRITLRKSLIVVQFAISLFFIITAIIISMQSNLLVTSDYGFTKENIINIKLQDANAAQYLNDLSTRTDVVQLSASSHVPATGQNFAVFLRTNIEEEGQRFSYYYVDQGYIDNLDLELVAGENFPDNPSDYAERHIILNETGVKRLGYESAHEAVGEFVYLDKNDSTTVQIRGVVNDYNHQILLMKIGPLALRNMPHGLQYANVKIKSNDMESTLAGLEASWKQFDEVHAFDYQFFDDQLEQSYGFIKDLNGIISITAFLAIVVSCLGLLGMAIYNVESRTKEVGVRKVMGARVTDIAYLLSKGFLLLIVIAVVVATPLTFYVNNRWLQMIAYRIDLGIEILGTGILILLGLGVLTVGSQAIRAAFSNPILALRDE